MNEIVLAVSTSLQKEGLRVEHVTHPEPETIRVEYTLSSSDPEEGVPSTIEMANYLGAFLGVVESREFRGASKIERLVLDGYDPEDLPSERKNLLRMTVMEKQARQVKHAEGEDKFDALAEVYETAQLVWEDGSVDDLDVTVTVNSD
jgi:hypothetical protein